MVSTTLIIILQTFKKNSLSCSSYSITDINEILKTFGIIDTMFNTISNAKIR